MGAVRKEAHSLSASNETHPVLVGHQKGVEVKNSGEILALLETNKPSRPNRPSKLGFTQGESAKSSRSADRVLQMSGASVICSLSAAAEHFSFSAS
jgi:hypothetical protein